MSKAWITRLFGAAVLLPGVIVVLSAVGHLLKAMGDQSAGSVLDRLALAGGVGWILVLLGLLLAVAARHAGADDIEE